MIESRPRSWLQGARTSQMPKWIARNPKAFRLLYEFAERSRWKQEDIEYENILVHLNVREFITGRESTSEKVGISEQEYRTLYRKFEKSHYIVTVTKTNKFTIGKYLADEIFFNNPPTEQPTKKPTNQPAVHQQSTTNNKENKAKKEYKNLTYINKYSSLKDITEKDLLEISNSYKVNFGFVKFQFEKLQNYCESSGKIYKDYNAALRNFVLRDMQSVVERRTQDGSKRGIDARGIK